MNTILDNLKNEAQRIKSYLEKLSASSSIKKGSPPRRSDDIVAAFATVPSWIPLNAEGRQAQSKVLEEYRHFYSLLKTLLREQPDDTLKKLNELNS